MPQDLNDVNPTPESRLDEEIRRRKRKVDLATKKGINPWGDRYDTTSQPRNLVKMRRDGR